VPLSQQRRVQPAAAVGLVRTHQWGEDVRQHLTQRMVHLRTDEKRRSTCSSA
jgi:hypothetical protein